MCDADYNGAHCCSSHNPCGIGGGDCDIDADCSGSLVCGVDNCQGFDSAWSYSNFDCCYDPAVAGSYLNKYIGNLCLLENKLISSQVVLFH